MRKCSRNYISNILKWTFILFARPFFNYASGVSPEAKRKRTYVYVYTSQTSYQSDFNFPSIKGARGSVPNPRYYYITPRTAPRADALAIIKPLLKMPRRWLYIQPRYLSLDARTSVDPDVTEILTDVITWRGSIQCASGIHEIP